MFGLGGNRTHNPQQNIAEGSDTNFVIKNYVQMTKFQETEFDQLLYFLWCSP